MNTVGKLGNQKFQHELSVGPRHEVMIVCDYKLKRPDWMELVVYLLISGQHYKIYDPKRTGNWSKSIREYVREDYTDVEASHARVRMDFEIPLVAWEAMNDEEAFDCAMTYVKGEIDRNSVYGYWIEKRDS